MRILHVTPSFYPAWSYGGIARCSYELCRALARQGEAVTVWTTDVCDATRRVDTGAAAVDGVQVTYFRNLSNRLAYGAQLYLPRGIRERARAAVADFDVAHLHGHRHLLNVLVGRELQRRGVPYVFTGHGTVPAIERWVRLKRLLDAAGAGAVLHRAAMCIAVSEAEVAHYRRAGVAPERIRVIPNGLRLEEFAALPPRGSTRRARGLGDGPLIVFVGKITPRKGVDVLLRALARLPAAVRLLVVGNFMMPAGGIERLVRALHLEQRVCFAGMLSGAEKLAAYVDADVVAYPAVHEIFGLVPFEALLCGAPVVVCDDSGCGEVVRAADGGLLVPYGDAAALAAALQKLLDDADLRRRMAAAGRQYVAQHLGWERIAARTLELYGEAVRGMGG